jgi:hypothetical protein
VDARRLDDDRSLALHQAVARKLLEDPTVLARARAKASEWLARGGRSAPLHARWLRVLAGSPDEVARFLTDPSEEAAWLRSASPFAGVLDPRTRLAILREVRRDRRELACTRRG